MAIQKRIGGAMSRWYVRTVVGMFVAAGTALIATSGWASESTEYPLLAQSSNAPVYRGLIGIPDPTNPAVGYELTDRECWLQVTATAPGNFDVESNFWPGVAVASNAEMGGGSFYLGRLELDEAFVLQLHEDIPVALTYTTFDENGELNYGVSGLGDMVAECMDIR